MSGLTVNFNFYLPAEGDGEANGQAWATAINGNFISIDAILQAHAETLATHQAARAQASVTTASLAPGAVWEGTITLPKTAALLRVATTRPAVVRAYGSAAARTADATRPYTEPPGGGTGLQFQGTSTADLLTFLVAATLSNDDDPASTTIYLSVQNRDTATGTITVAFTAVPMEH